MSGYPPHYGMGNNPYGNYQPPPPPLLYGYGGVNVPTPSYGGYAPSPAFNQPGQQYSGQYNINVHQQPSPHPPANRSSYMGDLYPSLSETPQAPPAVQYYGGAVAPVYQPQYQHQPPPPPLSALSCTSLEYYQGTIYPCPHFNAEADCRALSQAMKGIGTNECLLTEVTINRSNAQRQQIRLQYKTMFGVGLIRQLRGELRGHFRDTISALLASPAEFDARTLQEAMHDGRMGALSEVLLTRSNSEILAIIGAYRDLFNRNLEKDLHDRVRNVNLKRLLISAVQANRDELTPQQIQQARQMGIDSVIDRNRACQDADELHRAGPGRWGTDEKTFNCIFARYNYYQLRAVFEEYQRKYGKNIADVIRSEFSGDVKDAYLLLVTCVRDPPTYFAERIHRAISGLGTNDTILIRVIVTRSEIDLVQIKERYQQLFKHSLAQDVADDTSGDYRKILLSIIK